MSIKNIHSFTVRSQQTFLAILIEQGSGEGHWIFSFPWQLLQHNLPRWTKEKGAPSPRAAYRVWTAPLLKAMFKQF